MAQGSADGNLREVLLAVAGLLVAVMAYLATGLYGNTDAWGVYLIRWATGTIVMAAAGTSTPAPVACAPARRHGFLPLRPRGHMASPCPSSRHLHVPQTASRVACALRQPRALMRALNGAQPPVLRVCVYGGGVGSCGLTS